MGYRVKDWSQFQHFKDRTPPWIKLYRDILDDPDWHALDPADAKTLVMLWLIASEDKTHSGTLPDTRKLAFRLRMTEKQVNQVLARLSHWLDHDDINVITDRYQVDAPEERREETETEGRAKRVSFDPVHYLTSNGVSQQVATDWTAMRKAKKATPSETAIAGIEREASKAGLPLEVALSVCCERGWTGFKAEWVAGQQIAGAPRPRQLAI